MEIKDFLKEIEYLSTTNSDICLYPYTNREKLYSRFMSRVYVPAVEKMVSNSWVADIYHATNGIDLKNFYIVPFNNYLNAKPLPFEEFYLSWIVNQNNVNEIMIDFCAFMTDGKTYIGYLENLKDSNGNNFIGMAKNKPVDDVIIIASNVYNLLDYIVEQLKIEESLLFPIDENFWRLRDFELDKRYDDNSILKYKMEYLYQYDSDKYEHIRIERK